MAWIRSTGRKLGPTVQLDKRWGPNMMRRSGHEAQQVRCLTGDVGAVWIHGLDDLPALVRRRLATGVHNVCPTCLNCEAHAEAERRRRPLTVDLYFEVLEAIERKLGASQS